MKKSHEQFGEIIREHFDKVDPAEFKARLYDASHGTFGELASSQGDDLPKISRLKRVLTRVASLLHLG